MKLMTIAFTLITLASTSNAFATSKICYGSTKSDDTKGLAMTAEITEGSIVLKTIKGDYHNGTYPSLNSVVHGRDGMTYLEYKGESNDYQEDILVDANLLTDSTTGLLQVRARGEGFFNSVFVCRDAQ